MICAGNQSYTNKKSKSSVKFSDRRTKKLLNRIVQNQFLVEGKINKPEDAGL